MLLFDIYPFRGQFAYFLLTLLVYVVFVRRFRGQPEYALFVQIFKNIGVWSVFVQTSALLLFFASRCTSLPDQVLLWEFLEMWSAVFFLLALPLGSFSLPSVFIAGHLLWKARQGAMEGAACITSYNEAFSSKHDKTRSSIKPPAFNLRRALLIGLCTLVFVFAGLWMRTIHLTRFTVENIAQEAGASAAQSNVEKQKLQPMELATWSLNDDIPDYSQGNTEHWTKEYGFMEYFVKKNFVKGYNDYLEQTQKGERSGTKNVGP